MFCGALKMAQPYDYGRKVALNGQIKTTDGGFESCSISPDMGNDELRASEKERSSIVGFRNTLNSGNLGCRRMICILELWVLM